MQNVEAIVFDLDNTLVDTIEADRVACEKVVQMLYTSYARIFENPNDVITTFRQCLSRGTELTNDQPTSTNDARIAMWREALTRNTLIGVSNPDELARQCQQIWRSTRLDGMYLPPHIPTLLESLKRHFKLAILTNGPLDIQDDKVKAMLSDPGVPGDLFDAIIISGAKGYHKPDLRIFQDTCAELSTTPDKTVMVGDEPNTDILGGNFAGWRTVWFNPKGKPKPESISKHATIEISSLQDLAVAIEIPRPK